MISPGLATNLIKKLLLFILVVTIEIKIYLLLLQARKIKIFCASPICGMNLKDSPDIYFHCHRNLDKVKTQADQLNVENDRVDVFAAGHLQLQSVSCIQVENLEKS